MSVLSLRVRVRFTLVLLIAGFMHVLIPGMSRSQTNARAGGHPDTLALAIAAAQWASPQLPAGQRIALAYGTQRGRPVSGLIRNPDDAARLASAIHGVAVAGDSVRGCATPCAPGEFDVVVRLGGLFLDDTTALAVITVADVPVPGSRLGGVHGWEARFRYSDGRWVFDTVVSVMAS